MAVAVAVVGCGGGEPAHAVPRAGGGPAPALQVVSAVSLSDGGPAASFALPPAPWAVSFDVRVARGARVKLMLGGRTVLRVNRSVHVEASPSGLSAGGLTVLPLGYSRGPVALSVAGGRATVRALIISSSAGAGRGALLLHRLAELHGRVPAGRFPEGATVRDRIVYGDRYWTSGFWPGALWQAAALAPSGGLFRRWAVAATVAHFGQERSPTHDLGFMYGESSLAGWRALCRPRVGRALSGSRIALCARLKRSALAAAGELVALERTNARAGTIPTNPTSGNTIIDSMMNIALLPWASRVTGDPSYARVAARHAAVVASLLVRRDGSTAQSVNFDRASGRVLFVSTHQGLSARSTWSRGQGWAVYGFSQASVELHSVALLRVALRTAGYVARRLPAGGIPLWDYDAAPGSPVDVSAGVITAAGLMHLVAACNSFPGVCGGETGRWVALARRMLSAALGRASARPPLGLLRDQVLNERGRGCWCDGGELIFGLTYALEAENLLRRRG